MFRKNANIIVGMTTFCHQYLGVSIPGLGRLGRDFILVIYNDNPNAKLTRKQIRQLGYRGRLYIINGKYNVGQFQARMEILNTVRDHRLCAPWFVFVDDDDILTDINIPNVAACNFAIIQNAIVIKKRLMDVLGVMQNPQSINIDGDNVCVARPHLGMTGIPVRTKAVQKMAEILQKNMPAIVEIDESLNFRPPTDAMMWNALNITARYNDDNACPIYMDTVNYIKINIDTTDTKYGVKAPSGKHATAAIKRALDKYNRAILATLGADAAPAGHE